jgi:hypothetical protein
VTEPDGLFAEPPRTYAAAGEPLRERTAGERLRDKQAHLIAVGRHPLSDPPGGRPQYGILRLHPDACRDVRWSTGKAQIPEGAPTCGTCVHRQLVNGGARDWPKCTYGRVETPSPAGDPPGSAAGVRVKPGPRETHGDRSDVRAWWPACTDYEEAT